MPIHFSPHGSASRPTRHDTTRVFQEHREGRASSRPPSDARISGCPVVPMVDDLMTALCQELPHCIWPPLGTRASCPRRSRGSVTLPPMGAASSRAAPWGRRHLACGSRAEARPFGGAASSRATHRLLPERGRPRPPTSRTWTSRLTSDWSDSSANASVV